MSSSGRGRAGRRRNRSRFNFKQYNRNPDVFRQAEPEAVSEPPTPAQNSVQQGDTRGSGISRENIALGDEPVAKRKKEQRDVSQAGLQPSTSFGESCTETPGSSNSSSGTSASNDDKGAYPGPYPPGSCMYDENGSLDWMDELLNSADMDTIVRNALGANFLPDVSYLDEAETRDPDEICDAMNMNRPAQKPDDTESQRQNAPGAYAKPVKNDACSLV